MNCTAYTVGFDYAFWRMMAQAAENAERRRIARKKRLIPPGVQNVPFYIGAHRAKNK